MEEMELYNINFLLTNENNERTNELIDSFINIYATTLHNLKNVECLNMSPNHHFFEEFKDFIENYSEVENYLLSENKNKTLLIEGIRAVNVLYYKEIPIYINPFIDYIDENVVSFGISDSEKLDTNEDIESLYNKLNEMKLEIIDYGIINGAEKIKVLAKEKIRD